MQIQSNPNRYACTHAVFRRRCTLEEVLEFIRNCDSREDLERILEEATQRAGQL